MARKQIKKNITKTKIKRQQILERELKRKFGINKSVRIHLTRVKPQKHELPSKIMLVEIEESGLVDESTSNNSTDEQVHYTVGQLKVHFAKIRFILVQRIHR